MGADQTKPRQPRNFGEIRIQKKDELEQFLKSQMLLQRIYPPPNAQVIKTRCRKPTKPAPQKIIRMTLNTEPLKEKNETIIRNHDGRIRVHNTAKWPNCVHGLLAMNFKNKTNRGTGILIGPNLVLTAGHNLYDHELKAYADLASMQFLPGMSGRVLPFGLVEVEKYYVSPNYIKEEKEDYGILILKEPIGELTGYFGLACLEPEEIKGRRINVTGYPSDKVAADLNNYEMWGMEGQASHVDQNRGLIKYLIDTAAGQAGSGVWYQEGENYYVCGVHIMGTQFVDTATLLTRDIYAQIYNWIHEGSNSKWLYTLENIEKLHFENFQVDNEHLSLLVEHDLINLTTLTLISKRIDPQGASILAKNTSWVNLSMLDLYNNKIGPEGCKALAENTSWQRLSWLNLNRNSVSTEGVRALAKNSSWRNLSKLLLENNNIGPEGAMALAQNTSWTKLEYLKLASNDIDAEGAETLVKNSAWENLECLDLKDNDISPEFEAEIARILAKKPKAPSLNPSDRIQISW